MGEMVWGWVQELFPVGILAMVFGWPIQALVNYAVSSEVLVTVFGSGGLDYWKAVSCVCLCGLSVAILKVFIKSA
jgi:hypothetical protein